MESILTHIKKLLGITEEYTHFDVDIITHINAAFMVLTDLGVGPEEGFMIADESAVWDDFVEDETRLGAIRSYVYMKVKLMFDPPSSSAVIESMNRIISEFEWRIQVAADPKSTGEEET